MVVTVCISTLVSNIHSNVRIASRALVWLYNWYGYCDYFDCNRLTSDSNVHFVYRRASALSSRLLRIFQLEPTLQ